MADCPCCGQSMPEDAALRVDLATNTVFSKAGYVTVEPRTAELLFALIDEAPKFVNKDKLMWKVYGDASDNINVYDNLRVQVYRARRAIAPLGHKIETRWSCGYRIS